MAFQISDEHVRLFAVSLNREIEKYGRTENKQFLAKQKEQVERLCALEDEFRLALCSLPAGRSAYAAFIKMICDDRRNILSARPYFRERQRVFSGRISLALKKRSPEALQPFHFNFQFIEFAMRRRSLRRTRLARLYREVKAVRTELVEVNLPLAINRATIFWSRTPRSHLAYMDMLQICAEGLISGIDKFCLPFSRVFRSVSIGRMVGNLIEEYSETPLHFYPAQRRKIYRANKVVHKHRTADGVDWEGVAREINWDAKKGCRVKPEFRTTADEIAGLLAAASTVSADAPIGEEVKVTALDRMEAPEATRPDVAAEVREVDRLMRDAYWRLPLVDRKLLRLRGVTLSL